MGCTSSSSLRVEKGNGEEDDVYVARERIKRREIIFYDL
jgi:hypothetical protein